MAGTTGDAGNRACIPSQCARPLCLRNELYAEAAQWLELFFSRARLPSGLVPGLLLGFPLEMCVVVVAQ